MSPDIFAHQMIAASFLALLLIAAVWDVRSYRIPNAVTLAVLVLYPLHLLYSPVPVDWMSALAVSGGALLVGLALFACNAIGAGDVKLLAAVLLWAGPELAPATLLLVALAGGAIALAMTTSVRFGLAQAFDFVHQPALRDSVLGGTIPYAAAIAVGGAHVGYRLALS